MRILFSRKCEYAILATLYLSTKPKNSVVPVDEIAKQLKVPKEFVSKVLQGLKENKIIRSKKGKNGGFILAKPTNKIKILDVILAIDGNELFESCVIGFPNCEKYNPCPVHRGWKIIRNDIKTLFSKNTLQQLQDDFLHKIDKENLI